MILSPFLCLLKNACVIINSIYVNYHYFRKKVHLTKILNWNACKSKSINRKMKPSSSKSRRLWLHLFILILKRLQLLFTYEPYDMVYLLWNIYARIKTVLSRNNSCTTSCPRQNVKTA